MHVTGNIPIQDADPGVILHDVLMAQKTANLFNKRRKDLHSFFQYARKFHGLRFNPILDIEKITQDRNLIIILAETGARRSEVLRLTWSEDVDFTQRTIRLGNRKNRTREMRYRFIPISDDLYKALQDQFKRRLPESDYVFQNRAVWESKDGRIVRKHPNYGGKFTARRKFIRGLCKEAKVKPMGFHSLRRYFASKLVEQGQDLETIRQLMGHSSVSVTDRYIYRLRADILGKLAHGISTR